MLALTAPTMARAADSPITITATTLDNALTVLAQQTGTDIISTEPGLSRIRVKPIQGRMSVRAALDRLLAGSGYRAVVVDARSYRVVRDRRKPPPEHPAPERAAPPPSDEGGTDEIGRAHV